MTKPIDSRRWRTIEPILDRALDLTGADRAAFLDTACGGDHDLRAQVAQLLAAAERDGVLDDGLAPLAGGMLGDAHPLPDTIGPFRITGVLGQGGMGVVYAGERADGAFEQLVAIKVVRGTASRAVFTARFLAERNIQARLAHPNIARLLDGGSTPDGEPWFAMERVDGLPITRHADEHDLDLAARVGVFITACEAVRYAHGHGVVHRDLKPSNLLVTAEGQGQVKLLDFGIARVLAQDGEVDGESTRTEWRALTPEYAAPEQVRAEPTTPATDVYALGIVLYELLAGTKAQPVDRRASATAIERAICEGEPPPLKPAANARGYRVDDDLATIVATALHKDPGRRYATAAELLEDLLRWQAHLPIRARPDSRRYRLIKYLRRHRVAVGAAAAVITALAIGTIAALRQASVARDEAARAGAAREFLVQLFEASTPREALGREVTARELLDRGAATIDRTLGDRPRLHADLLGELAGIYRELGLYDRADTVSLRALTVAQRVDGGRGRLSAEQLVGRAAILRDLGQPAAAESLLATADTLRRRSAPRDRELEARLLHARGLVLVDLGDGEQAVAALERALELTQQHPDAEPVDVARELNALGIALNDVGGDLDRADSMLHAALAIRRRTLPPAHPALLATLTNLADVRRQLGKYDEALALLEEEITIRRRVLGPDHPDMAYSYNALALLAEEQGRYADAESLHVVAVDLRRRTLGADHPTTLGSVNNLAVVRYRMNDLAGAAEAFREAADGFRRAQGTESRNYNTALNNLGVVLTGLGRYREAESRLREALRLRLATQGDSTVDVAASFRNLGVVEQRTGRLAGAERNFRAALAIYRRIFDEPSTRTAEALLGLGEVLTARGAAHDALPLLEEAVAVRDSLLVAGDYRRGEALVAFGRALAATGQAARARQALESAGTIFAGAGRRDELAETRRLLALLR